MLRMIGAEYSSGNVVEFELSDIEGPFDQTGMLVVSLGGDLCAVVDPATIQPADDPRKAMLDEIRKWLGYVQRVEDKVNGWGGYSEDEVDAILDEMEAKL